MTKPVGRWIKAGPLEELRSQGMTVVKGGDRPILVVCEGETVFALDNRCPHMGFPLHRGSFEDGVLTCHWHHARFDVSSGCTFDLWADDIPTARVKIEDDAVWIESDCGFADPAEHWRRRLQDGMAHAIGLVIAKSILGARAAGVAPADLIRDAALFGAANRDRWGSGATTLTALANLLPLLDEEQEFLALYQGVRRLAADCAGKVPRRDVTALADASVPRETLRRWLRHWTQVRHRTGAERTLKTAIADNAPPAALAEMLLTAGCDRAYADGGHSLDFVNKAFECLDLIGWENAGTVLPTITDALTDARGAEESISWRSPVDLVGRLEDVFSVLPALMARGRESAGKPVDHAALAQELLADDPEAIIDSLCGAIRDGACPTDLSRALVYASVLRVAHFATTNESSDWDTAHHSLTYCNAVHQLLRRIENDSTGATQVSADALRAVFHGAMTIYLTRYLNVPPARLPDAAALDDLPADPDTLCRDLLDAFDRQQQVDRAAYLTTRYLTLGHSASRLINTLITALLREDAGFHTYQMLEACVQHHREWDDTAEGRTVLVALARFLAAHSPTRRAQHQTAAIAMRLNRGGDLYEDQTNETE